ncbi:type II toxin-antitoxin system PemK/MazF family toxin [Candidatus Thiodictyon syntrophicum]|jgi:mRNA interferase MazF|uniref:mRNA interferase n=1 Tax=Candidatus Thiodictyon syntrophicum TaxID=1166950 RepID=A0A2K8UI95_9GAMM|nr:type II toxin-antitoxin system PemK/MazF family toxin [Candidatus Thiodictyon syntrophicum]AUB85257.1 MazF family transcriptional regulator [Candidatus Thiodictyon syntrophicum]
MKRGDILYADLSPSVGSEINKRRPVLIVSNDANNRAASTVTILPITSNMTRVYPFEVALSAAESGLPKDSKAQAQQIRTIAKERIPGPAVGRLAADKMRAIDTAIRLHLAL